ncbi:VanZ family protein [Gracilibacillus boraciitolerans]|uniref:VanZ family protein n=1 Tax=Gracilibacillus boraciitolerans TaxID=307521 RepID=UPI0034E241D8
MSFLQSFLANSNLIPFSNTYHYVTGSEHFPLIVIFNSIIENILVFLPLGLLLPLLFRSCRKFSKIVLAVSFSTVLVEVTQTTFLIVNLI